MNSANRKIRLALHWQIFISLLVGGLLGLLANWLAARPSAEAQLQPPPVIGSEESTDPYDRDGNGIDDRLDWLVRNITDPVGRVFLRLIFMVVIPLVFSALALAVIEIGDLRWLGRLGLRTFLLTVSFSTVAVVMGIALVNIIQPGRTLSPQQRDTLKAQYQPAASKTVDAARHTKPLRDVLVDIIPENPLQEMVGAMDGSSKGNGLLAVMFFALVCGIAISVDPETCHTLVLCLRGLNRLAMSVIGFAMRLAPLGVGCLVFGVIARMGLTIFPPLAGFIAAVTLGLLLQMLVVYSLALWLIARASPWKFFVGIADAILTAFGTSSSNATLPTALRVAQEKLHLPRQTANFVLTIGATGNQNGTALYEGVLVLFLAQVFGVELDLGQQITVVLMAVLAGVGTAGVPGASLPMIVALLAYLRVPAEGIGIILGIDRFLDMSRTVVNVTGDLAIAVCVSGRNRKPPLVAEQSPGETTVDDSMQAGLDADIY